MSLDTLERSKDVVFIVDSELRMTYHNPAWDVFALANGGPDLTGTLVLGIDLMSVIAEPLRTFYSEVFRRCRRRHLDFQVDYECSSAEVYRELHMRIMPLKSSGGLAFVNSTRVEKVHGTERPALRPADIYMGASGLATMCCHCRRTQRQDATEIWDWVPDYCRKKKWEISYGMCPICVSYFYSSYLTANTDPDAA